MNCRGFLIALGLMLQALLFSPQMAGAETRSFVDAAGRKVEIPDNVHRVLAAGPPASLLLYALAPDKMVGWCANRARTRRHSSPRLTTTCPPMAA